MRARSLPELLLRIGVSFAFLYPAIDAIFNPTVWIGYFPHFVTSLYDQVIGIPFKLSDVALLHMFGLVEVALAVWLLAGRRVRVPALVMAFFLFLIVLVNLSWTNFLVLFGDISIALAALALASMDKKPKS